MFDGMRRSTEVIAARTYGSWVVLDISADIVAAEPHPNSGPHQHGQSWLGCKIYKNNKNEM